MYRFYTENLGIVRFENPELVSKLGQDIVVIDISGIKVADRVDETEMAKEKRFQNEKFMKTVLNKCTGLEII